MIQLTEEQFQAFVAVAVRASDVLYGSPLPIEHYAERLAAQLKRLKAVVPYVDLAEPKDTVRGEHPEGWFIYAERTNGEWFVAEGPTTEALARQKAGELNGRLAEDGIETEFSEDGHGLCFFWASVGAFPNPPNAYRGDYPVR